jgi:putative NIF3 family GTP cyclohydrolase 1 type 2
VRFTRQANPLVRLAQGHDRLVETVAICAGAGESLLKDIEADLIFTGEMSHHNVLAHVAKSKNVILVGHSNSERGFLPQLASQLNSDLKKEGLDDIKVEVSKSDKCPWLEI